jgi:hypothetical protein
VPASSFDHIPTVLHFVTCLRPAAVLDVGVGNGAYGFLIRQYLDIGEQRLSPAEWRLRVEGVEIFPKYHNPVWDFAYDRIYLGDAREILPTLGKYDIVLLNDVLEHFDRAEARALVEVALGKAPVIIATTPASDYPQGEWAGNPAEAHLCTLARGDFPEWCLEKPTGETNCYVCGSNPQVMQTLHEIAANCPIPCRPPVPPVGSRLGTLSRSAVSLARRVIRWRGGKS